MRRTIKGIFSALLLVAAGLGVMASLAAGTAFAQQHVVVDRGYIVNTSSVNLETIACNAGVSPCTIGASSTTVFNSTPSRHECLIQNVGTTDFYCLKGVGTVSTTNMHFVLKAASAANKGDGGLYSCNAGPVVFTGVISCISSAAGGVLTASGD